MKLTLGPLSFDILLFLRLCLPGTVFIGLCTGILLAFNPVLLLIDQITPRSWLLLLILYIILGVAFTHFAAHLLRASFGSEELRVQRRMPIMSGFPFYALCLFCLMAGLVGGLLFPDVALDPGKGEAKTENIIRCIDYSHSNLSPDAQQLLACLAPFTSVVWQDMLEGNYTDALKQQPALKDLPFERWAEVIQQATNWGLVHPDADVPQFLRMQPILPYFLRALLPTRP